MNEDNQITGGHVSIYHNKELRKRDIAMLKKVKEIEKEKRKNPEYKVYKIEDLTIETANPNSKLIELARQLKDERKKLIWLK